MKNANNITTIPTKIIEGLNILHKTNVCNKQYNIYNQEFIKEVINFPISTYETPLFASIKRGIKVSKIHPISVAILSNCMTRSAIFQCKSVFEVEFLIDFIKKQQTNGKLQEVVNTTSNHCKIKDITFQVVGNLAYARFSYDTSEASGHNMTTIATNELAKWIVENFKIISKIDVKYLSNSGNTCCDKKVSAINSISGRGKNVIAEIVISRQTCNEILHTTPEKIVELNIKKNLIGSTLAGSLCSANAHYANMLASIYLPLGQDIANIVEGSQGITHCEVNDNDELYFSVNLPNIICGCVGNGKDLDFVKENLKLIGCLDENYKVIDYASERMAKIICAVVLCGELSLMSALTNQDELVKSHIKIERKK